MRRAVASGLARSAEPSADASSVPPLPSSPSNALAGGNLLLNTRFNKDFSDLSLSSKALSRLISLGFSHSPEPSAIASSDPARIAPYELSRGSYASMYGPTVGDRLRLGDTELWVEIERDETVYGDECKFGGGACLSPRPTQGSSLCEGSR